MEHCKRYLLLYQAIASGSNGNCAVLSTDDGALLIDAGISRKRIINGLKELNISPSHVKGILITHAHSDHINGLPVLSKYLSAPVISTPGTIAELALLHGRDPAFESIARDAIDVQLYASIDHSKFTISLYPALHDINGACGFTIQFGDTQLSYATDTGGMEEGFQKSMRESDIIVLESNHDEQLLLNSRRSSWLKTRIRNTHLSNKDAKILLDNVITEQTKLVMMAHISRECNSSQHVIQSIQTLESQSDYDWQWSVCTRYDKSTLVKQKDNNEIRLYGGLSCHEQPNELLSRDVHKRDNLDAFF